MAQAHIRCTCKKEQKIPVLDLAFIKAQRDKTGSTSSYQIGLPDYPETRRQVNALRNREEKRRKQERRERRTNEKAQEDDKGKEEAQAFIL